MRSLSTYSVVSVLVIAANHTYGRGRIGYHGVNRSARGSRTPPGSDGASPYRPSTRCRLLTAGLERRPLLRAILLVLVVVVVLDLLLCVNRSARLTHAARFGRSWVDGPSHE
jgi:hypothetical protein